jgi:hypothetical protein
LDLEVLKNERQREVDALLEQLEDIQERYDEHVWDRAIVELGYTANRGPDIAGISSLLIKYCAGHFGVSPHQFSWWCRKYDWVKPQYSDLEQMISDILHGTYIAWIVTTNQRDDAICKDLYQGI